MSGFHVRRVSTMHRSISQQIKQFRPITITPQRAIFQKYQSNELNMLKFTLKNDSNKSVDFEVFQPHSNFLKVKSKLKQISPSQSLQIYLIFQSQQYSQQISDSFTIKFNSNYSIFVPIIIKPSTQKLTPQQKSKKKQVSITLGFQEKIVNKFFPSEKEKSRKKLPLKRILNSSITDSVVKQYQGRKIKRKNGEIISTGKIKFNAIEDMIQAFLVRYSNTNHYLKDKQIKNQIFLGEISTSQNKKHEINSFNALIQFFTDERLRKEILCRYETVYTDGPDINVRINYQPRWDTKRNQPKITHQKAMRKFHEEIRKIIVNYRFEKIHKFMTMHRKFNIDSNFKLAQAMIISNFSLKNKQEQGDTILSLPTSKKSMNYLKQKDERSQKSLAYHSSMQILEEQQEKISFRQQINEQKQKIRNEYYWNKVKNMLDSKSDRKLGYDFNYFSLVPRILEQDYSNNYFHSDHKFEIQSRVGFDNWISIQESHPCIHEMMSYQKISKMFEWECHPVLPKNKINGAQCSVVSLQEQQIPSPLYQAQNQITSVNMFVEICHKPQTCYKNYTTTNPLLEEDTFQNLQIEENIKESPASTCMSTIKYFEQDYIPYFTKKQQKENSFVYQNIYEDELPTLMIEVNRQDKIDFDKKLDRITGIKLRRMRREKISLKERTFEKRENSWMRHSSKNKQKKCRPKTKERSKFKRVRIEQQEQQKVHITEQMMIAYRTHKMQDKNQDDQTIFQELIQNLQKIKQKDLLKTQGRIQSWNQYIKNQQNNINL